MADTISTVRHPVVRYIIGDEVGDVFGKGDAGQYDGLTLTVEAAAQADYERRILSAITIRSASDVAAEARAGAIEAAVEAIDDAGYYCVPPYEETGSLPNQIDHSLAAIRALHDTDTLAAIERIKEQARKEERERCHNAIMSRDIEEHYSEGGRIQFDDLQEFFAATVDAATTEDE